METDGGGWTVFQRREDGSIDFDLNWADYEDGFGILDHEFWLGLSKIYRLTEAGVSNTLRIDLGDAEGNTAYATYSTFNIGDSSTEYTLTVAGYSGNAGDDMASNHNLNGQKFTTKDNDNSVSNCAIRYGGPWWHNNCAYSNLNAQYHGSSNQAITWYHWKNRWEPLKFSEMKIRRN